MSRIGTYKFNESLFRIFSTLAVDKLYMKLIAKKIKISKIE